ncbi:hypothetical protein JXB37_05865, partial [candidate division WOR-3 bacterium]|nr:hypothetical protein [candidate division WOR-3 bacterium]
MPLAELGAAAGKSASGIDFYRKQPRLGTGGRRVPAGRHLFTRPEGKEIIAEIQRHTDAKWALLQ